MFRHVRMVYGVSVLVGIKAVISLVAPTFMKFSHVSLPVVIRIWFKCCCVEQAVVPSNQGLPTITLCVILW